jgi:hypothetical protein
MPDLDRRIADWRRTLAETAGCRDDVIEELESHLRDEMQRLILAGEPEERALDLAIARLGTPQTLGAEFAKVAWDGPTRWLPVYFAHGLMIALAVLLIGYCVLAQGRFSLLLASHVIAVTIGYSATFAVGGLATCYVATRSFRPLHPGQMRALTRAVFALTWLALGATTLGVVLGGFWARDNLGRFWGWDPQEIGGAFVLAWDAVMVYFWWRRPAATHAAMLLAFVGNGLVAAAWFGPSMLGVGLHAYGSPMPTVAVLTGLAVGHLALIGLGLAPSGCLRRTAA